MCMGIHTAEKETLHDLDAKLSLVASSAEGIDGRPTVQQLSLEHIAIPVWRIATERCWVLLQLRDGLPRLSRVNGCRPADSDLEFSTRGRFRKP